MNGDVMKSWLTPAGVALIAGVFVAYTAFKVNYSAMASQVNTNTEAVAAMKQGLNALKADKLKELQGRRAVLEHIARNGGLNEGQRLELENIKDRIRALQ